jgi:hypothetical protein
LRHCTLQGVTVTGSQVDQRPLLRVGLAAVVIVDLVSFHSFLSDARVAVLANGFALSGIGDLISRPAVKGALVLAGVAGAVAFASKPGRLWYGTVPLGALMLLSTAHSQLSGSPWRHLYYSGLCLAGWLLGLVVSRRRGTPLDESYARMGTIALLGAAYFNAGVSKIAFAGLDWLSGLPLQAAVVAQDGLVADGVASTYRSWVVTTPTVAALFSVLTVVFELAGPLMIAGRGIRVCIALGLLAMHLNIWVMTPILYWESMVVLLLFGLSADRWDAAIVPPPTDSILTRRRTFVMAVGLLALCAVFIINHQAARFARSRAAHSAVAQPAAPSAAVGEPQVLGAAPTAGRLPLRQVGPLVVGQTLVDTWLIDALNVTDDAILVSLAGQPGRVRFEVTCHSEHRSPFDLGEAHILYSQHTEFGALEGAGWELRRRLEEASEGRDICDEVADWVKSAQ